MTIGDRGKRNSEDAESGRRPYLVEYTRICQMNTNKLVW